MPTEKTNKHGIKVLEYRTSHWGHTDKAGVWHNAIIQVPECCWTCKHLDGGESNEYGDCLTPPSCMIGVWMPTKKGKCWKQHKPLK